MAEYVHNQNSLELMGLSHHDLAVRYLTGYMHMAYGPSTPKDIRDFYHRLASNDIVGPNLRTPIGETIPILTEKIQLPATDRLKNYKKDDINLKCLTERIHNHIQSMMNMIQIPKKKC